MLRPGAVDVVVLLRETADGLAACLDEIERHGGFGRLIVIADPSVDAEVASSLRDRAAARPPGQFLVRTAQRRGAAAAINLAMGVTRNDVVVLDPDAVVTAGWLDRIARCGATDAAIGTVSPFSGDAGPCSLARPGEARSPFEEPAQAERAIEAAGGPYYPDVSVGAETCIFLRRRLVDEIGRLDETAVTAGAAIADLCRRASDAGWRNVLCDDTFVGRRRATARAGGSVQAESSDDHARQASSGVDSVEPIRAMIRSRHALLAAPDEPGVLHVLHDLGGGTERYVEELISAFRNDYRHFFLRILPDRFRLTDLEGAVPSNYDRWWRLADGGAALSHYDFPRTPAGGGLDAPASVCAFLGIGLVHVHSLVGSGDDLLGFLAQASLPYCYTVHDMYLPCPTVYLIGSEGEYCRATTDVASCRRCLAKLEKWRDVDIERWRSRYAAFVRGASNVFAPSRWAADTLAKYFPDIRVVVAPPWPERREPLLAPGGSAGFELPADGCAHIGVLGAIGPEKGARQVEALARRIRERSLPLRIVVVGYTDREQCGQSADRVLTVHGPYVEGEVGALLDRYRIDLALFPTIWPETFGYTLTEAWAAGRPAVVPKGGALQERIDETGAGWIMPPGWDPDRVLDQLVALCAPEGRGEIERRGRLGKVAARAEAGGRERVAEGYRAMLAGRRVGAERAFRHADVLEAACRAAGVASLRRPAARVNDEVPRQERARRWLMTLLRR